MKKETYEYRNLNVHLFLDDDADACALVMFGSMDTDAVIEFRTQIREKLLLRRYDYIIDLSQVTYLSSTALGLLMFIAAHKKNVVYVLQPPKSIATPLRILGIHPMFKYVENYDELSEKMTFPSAFIDTIKDLFDNQQEIAYKDRWLKILHDYLTNEQILEELNTMMPYIKQAEKNKKITIPSDKKYTCIAYHFLENLFRKVAKFDKNEIDDYTIELIVKELIQNSVIHGYDNKKEGVIEIQYSIDASHLTIEFIDYGKGMTEKKEDAFPPAGLDLLSKIFNNLEISEAPKNKVNGLVLGRGTKVTLTKSLIPTT
ncbi:ATP-binding protein [candidate division WOR-3 bacterium]|nr:ATP-binding protein [candidate division WOR-3 bacterium]